ncbi:MAG: hypothetical protein RML95_07210 [Anaerolineae bacterium]|nr:hypothetical protein [Anaerolineae bacterium]MDW8299111.1 hypothetical protein [Anaerolineae bacterium]
MDVSLVMDQLLENTTLFANMGDAEANYLLSWTRRILPSLVGEIADETLGWQKVEALKETLRAANALIARFRTASQPTLLELLRNFLRQYANTFERPDASEHPVVPELAEIMRAQPDNVSALRALLDFAEHVRPPTAQDAPLTSAQSETIQNVRESLNLLRSTLGELADSLSAFLPDDQLAQLRSRLEALNTDIESNLPDNQQGQTDES